MTLVAVDPGKTTGLCVFAEGEIITRAQIAPYNSVEAWILAQRPEAIICERWDQRFRAAKLEPVEVIGIVKLIGQKREIPVFFQQPSQAKDFFHNEVLKRLDLYLPALPHAMDATRHMLYHLSFTLKNHRWLDQLV